MKISDLKINHLINPIGYDLSHITISFLCSNTTGSTFRRVRILERMDDSKCLFDSGYENYKTGSPVELKLKLMPRTRYNVILDLRDETENIEEHAFFETGKMDEPWEAKWVGDNSYITGLPSPVMRKKFSLQDISRVERARLYVTGLGLYECYLNGEYVNDGYLQPGFNNYNLWTQVQTFDVTDLLRDGNNAITFMLGDGWYRGRFGVAGGHINNFGQNLMLIFELHIELQDKSVQLVKSDENMTIHEGCVSFSNIYDGEIYDAEKMDADWKNYDFDDHDWNKVSVLSPDGIEKLTDRFSVPVVKKDELKPVAITQDKENNIILDYGQNITGWLVFRDTLKKGDHIRARFGELLEDGALCTGNLLTAKQEFEYTSDGRGDLVREHFTYFGFRYVELSGDIGNVEAEEFRAWSMCSDLDETISIKTGNEKINKLLSNIFWSQRDNFLEHPSDCPQRAERLGWTGDAQMYCGTASYFMDTHSFFRKYVRDINEEQVQKGGMVPFIIPKIEAGDEFDGGDMKEECSAAWSDSAVIIPWTLYKRYNDKLLLREQYPGMKAWVDFVRKKDKENGNLHLWKSGFHFGDWLSLDNPEPGPFGKTDPFYIASCFYYYSTRILSEAAEVLGYEEDRLLYGELSGNIMKAIKKEYFDEEGVCLEDTQTGYILAIHFGIAQGDEVSKNGARLVEKIDNNNGHLDTGFVGTPYICHALTKSGYASKAYDLLLEETYPGWLYEVNKGATTIWESWDALGDDGKLTGDASLNHYCFGSVAQWVIEDCAGINVSEWGPDFSNIKLTIHADKRLKFMEAVYKSIIGSIGVKWEYTDDGSLTVRTDLPEGINAEIEIVD